MWPPPEGPPAPPPPELPAAAGAPAPPGMPAAPGPGGPGSGPPGGPGAVPPAAPGALPPEDPGRPWLRWAAFALGVVTAALVILAVILVTRSAPSAPPSARATASPSPASTDTPLPTLTPVPTTAPPTPTAPPPASSPAEQAAILFPAGGTECGADGLYTGCPVTGDLVRNATRWRSEHPRAPVPLCRCQSSYTSPAVSENRRDVLPGNQGDPSFDAVDVALTLAPGGSETIVVLFNRQSDGTWLAYDTYCGGADPANRLSAGAPTTC